MDLFPLTSESKYGGSIFYISFPDLGIIQNIPLKISTLSEELYFLIALQVVVHIVKLIRIHLQRHICLAQIKKILSRKIRFINLFFMSLLRRNPTHGHVWKANSIQ